MKQTHFTPLLLHAAFCRKSKAAVRPLRAVLWACLGFMVLVGNMPLSHAQEKDGVKNYYASLKSAEVNVRTGPGTQYPILWIFKRQNYPVKVVASYQSWRKIQDPDGEQGWVYQTLVSRLRTTLVSEGKPAPMFRESDGRGRFLLLEAGVQARVMECQRFLCKLEVAGQRGWVERNRLLMVEDL